MIEHSFFILSVQRLT